MRRVVANLDAEDAWARLRYPHLPRPTLSRAARRRMSALGTLLRVFCEPGDRLWLPEPVDPERLPVHPGLPRPILESGPPHALDSVDSTRVWGAVPDWPSEVDPAIAARWNDRNIHLALFRALFREPGHTLPHSRTIRSLDELENHLVSFGAAPFGSGAWVLKAPLSAAGRSRVIHPGGDAPVPTKAIRRLLHAHGPLLFEPWLDRVDDYGLLFDVRSDGELVAPSFHRQLVDDRGGFLGIELGAGLGLSDDEKSSLREIARRTARRLASEGYTGPVGIDFWRFRTPSGEEKLHPLGELNGRLTFGRVARALAATLLPRIDRPRIDLDDPAAPTVRLRLYRGDPTGSDTPSLPLLSLPLLKAGADDPTSARLEIFPNPFA